MAIDKGDLASSLLHKQNAASEISNIDLLLSVTIEATGRRIDLIVVGQKLHR